MKSAILITGRMKSTRLPKKVTLPIEGEPMIVHMLNRLKLAQVPSHIIICTSINPQDDILEQVAGEQRIECYRGSEDDVLQRLTEAAKKYSVEVVVNCTADNPFVDPVYVDKLIAHHIKEGNDFTKVEGLPFGVFSYAVSYPAMLRALAIKNESDTEVWGGYFTQTGLFKHGALKVEEDHLRRPEIRLTVDTPDDFRLVSEIFKGLYRLGKVFSLAQIITFLDSHPDIATINSHIQQKPGIPIKLK